MSERADLYDESELDLEAGGRATAEAWPELPSPSSSSLAEGLGRKAIAAAVVATPTSLEDTFDKKISLVLAMLK